MGTAELARLLRTERDGKGEGVEENGREGRKVVEMGKGMKGAKRVHVESRGR